MFTWHSWTVNSKPFLGTVDQFFNRYGTHPLHTILHTALHSYIGGYVNLFFSTRSSEKKYCVLQTVSIVNYFYLYLYIFLELLFDGVLLFSQAFKLAKRRKIDPIHNTDGGGFQYSVVSHNKKNLAPHKSKIEKQNGQDKQF